jgi:hypothetical protein
MAWEVAMMVMLVVHILPAAGYGEPASSGHPTWQERANLVFVNAVRIGMFVVVV